MRGSSVHPVFPSCRLVTCLVGLVTIALDSSSAGLEQVFGKLSSWKEALGQVWGNQCLCGSEGVCHSFVAYGHYEMSICYEMCLWSKSLSWRSLPYCHSVAGVPGSLALEIKSRKEK